LVDSLELYDDARTCKLSDEMTEILRKLRRG